MIETLYAQLVETDQEFHSLIKPFQPAGEPQPTEKFSAFIKKYNEYYRFFQKKRIYFPPQMCETIDKLNRVIFVSHLELSIYPLDWDSPEFSFHPSLVNEKREYWTKVWDRYNSDVVNLKKELENSFRLILGVETQIDSNKELKVMR